MKDVPLFVLPLQPRNFVLAKRQLQSGAYERGTRGVKRLFGFIHIR